MYTLIQLLTELYLVALSPSLPQTCKYIYHAVKSFPPFIHAQYIYGRHPPSVCFPFGVDQSAYISGTCVTQALLHPICTVPVLKSMVHIISSASTKYPYLNNGGSFLLPKRVFRYLEEDAGVLGPNSEPLPLLRFLCSPEITLPTLFSDIANSHSGYPLVRAVHAGFIHLIRFLLNHGADPRLRGCMAVKVAIGKKDLSLVKMLIEFEPEGKGREGSAKRRRRLDRVTIESFMLDLAVRCDARDIVRYFVHEKGCVPHLRMLKVI